MTLIKKDKNNRRTCLRCGKDYVRLDKHLKSKRVCDAIYLDIPQELVRDEYDLYYKDYYELILGKMHKCFKCGKSYKYASGLSKHKRCCNGSSSNSVFSHGNTQYSQSFKQTNNYYNVNYIDNRKTYNIILQNFGNEVLPDMTSLLEKLEDTIKNIVEKSEDNEGESIFNVALRALYIDTEENRNLIIRNTNDGFIDVRVNNGWITKSRKSMRDLVIDNTKRQIDKFLELADKRVKDNDTKDTIRAVKAFYNRYINSQEYNEKLLYSLLINHLIANKYILTEFQKKTKIIETDELKGEEKDLLTADVLNNFEKCSRQKSIPKVEENDLVEEYEESDVEDSIDSIDGVEKLNIWLNMMKSHGEKILI